MESLHTKRLIKRTLFFAVIVGLMVYLPYDSFGQDLTNKKQYPPHLQKKLEQMRQHLKDRGQLEQSTNQLQPRQSGVDLQTLSAGSEYTVLEHDQSWNRNPNPNPQNNFALFGQGQPAGDINGDGKDDFVVVDLARDEKTSTLEDQVWKTAVFFGGNTSGDPDQFFRSKLIPVGDLNGDGYADAVVPQSGAIYQGTGNGYSDSEENVSAGFNSGQQQIGFHDYNRDGYDDVLSYDPYDGDIVITWGEGNLTDVFSTTYLEKLAYDSKRVVVEDVDKDTLKEIVELSGYAGDNGQLKILEVDSMAQSLPSYDAITTEQSFSYSGFRSNADWNDLHLLDINGNGFFEIYISEGRYAQKHVVEYDSTNGSYNTTPIAFFDGSLVPAGDLNNDGMHDFIRGDASNDYDPYIAYGNTDLNTASQLDVPLSGNGGTDWSWNMGYNPYSNFGDLTGDGIDDVLMEHGINDAGSETVGRRILNGASETSDFHQYPLENYYSSVWGTQEIGDVNDDGVEDFAMSFPAKKKVEIYFGGSSLSATPDKIIQLDYEPATLTSGDFNGDGVSDIVIGSYFFGDNSAKVSFYFGSASLDVNVDKTIRASDFQVDLEINDLYNPQNVGDVDNDGIDDLLIGSSAARDSEGYVNDAYLFFGGQTISSTPNIILSLEPEGDYIWAGEGSAALGDINEDGIDDFAVSAPAFFNEGGNYGRVYIYYGNEAQSFSEPDIVLESPADASYIGWGIASGDFSGDGVNDVAITSDNVASETEIPALLHIFYGGADMDETRDEALVLPNFMLENGVGADGAIFYNFALIKTIPDFTNDGKDELLLGTYAGTSHAALYLFTNEYEPTPEIAVKAPNRDSGLGGYFGMAVGDFTGNGQNDLVLTQPLDNNDAYQSSRVYRYGLPTPIQITSVEDVPNDQGGKVRLNLGGAFADAIFNEGIVTDVYEFEVEYLDENDEWTGKGKYGADVDPSGANYLEVDGLTTQPSNTQSVDNSYTFRVKLLNGQSPQPMAVSDTASGAALDNIAPAEVSGVDISGQGAPVISWSPVDDVADVDYLIYSADDAGQLSDNPISSTTNTSFSLPDSYEGVQSFAVKARDENNNIGAASTAATAIYPKTIDYDVRQGWNLIGLPVDADAEGVQAVLDAAGNSAIYEYNGGYQEVEQLEAGQGYWAKFSTTDLYQLEGLPVTELTLKFDKGWNLVSGVGGKLPIDAIQDSDEIILPNTLYVFDQAYASSDTLQPSNGYWIRTSSAGTVTFVHPKLLPNEGSEANQKNALAKKVEEAEDEFTKITISDGSHSRELLFGAELPDQINKLSYSLPPLPPGDVFDARFEGDMRLVEKEGATISLSRIEGSTLTVKVGTESGAEHGQFVVKELVNGNQLAEYQVAAGDEFNVHHSETNALSMAPVGSSVLSDQGIPDEFKLDQNYPNPFNPSTQIHYSVAEASSVQLEVFNILGRRVATLVNKEQQPGNYKVTFDASHLASGVYLYRLRAGAQVSTKKLILAK